MRLLGIDFGRAKIGLAVSEGFLAEPYSVVRYEEEKELLEKIKALVDKEQIDKVVVGVSEGKSAEEATSFGEKLRELGLEIIFFDETLSTVSAQQLSREAGMKRKKRKALEDAFAASVMLQSFLDSNV
jgi:putative Holliday junction resolvase